MKRGRPPRRAFRRPSDAERLGTTNFGREPMFEALVRMKSLQAAGEQHQDALQIVAEDLAGATGNVKSFIRALQRWHSDFSGIAASEARRDRYVDEAVADGVRFLHAWSVLTIDLVRVAEKYRTPSGVIVAAVDAAQAEADAAGVQLSEWMLRESTRQKIAELLTST